MLLDKKALELVRAKCNLHNLSIYQSKREKRWVGLDKDFAKLQAFEAGEWEASNSAEALCH